jgi:hypothetical protein
LIPPSRIAALVLALLVPGSAIAEEGGTGHYTPGTISSFMDGVSAKPVFIARLNGLYYGGDLDGSRGVPIAGQTALDVDVESEALGLTLFWAPGWGQLSERWTYALNATVPFMRVEVEADVEVAGRTVRRSDTEYGLGDIVFSPLMLNYHVSDDLNLNGRLNVYAPSGSYEEGRLANLGKNYWSFEPMVGAVYLGQQNGIEASLFFGATFNTRNTDTSYETGTQLHLDFTLAQHFPLFGALMGAGLTGYWYQQVEGDGGSGATLGDFKGRTHGLGPTLSYTHEIGALNFASELKWVHEFSTRNRPEGDVVILKAMLAF